MKHIGIVGSFGSGNQGDEAAWMSIQRFLESKDPQWKYHTHIFQWSQPYQTCGHKFHPIYALTENEMQWINNNFKAMIIVGGGIVGWQWGFTKLNGIDKLLKALTIPIYTLSISAEKGEYDELTTRNTKTLQEVSKVFTVRDTYSQENIEKITGIKPDITPDVVSILGEKYPMLDNDKMSKLKEILMINASNCLEPKVVDIWKEVFSKLGGSEKVSCIPFIPSRNDIMLAMMTSSINTFEFFQPEEMMSMMKGKKFILAGRLHAAVFAATMKIPFFAINYHPKVKAYCDSIGYPHYYPKTNDLPLDKTEYGFDLMKINKDELISEIKQAMDNPIIPPDYKTAMGFLNTIYEMLMKDDMTNCMYCGEDVEITVEGFFKCPHCQNTNPGVNIGNK